MKNFDVLCVHCKDFFLQQLKNHGRRAGEGEWLNVNDDDDGKILLVESLQKFKYIFVWFGKEAVT